MNWQHHRANLGGLRLHYVEAGRGPLIVLLHGFPEFWYSWRHQILALASAGFRVLAPDLRGYNESDKPSGIAAYRVDRVAGDVAALVRHAGEEQAAIAGHDWGGGIAWWLAIHRPDAVRRLIVLNAPHPAAMRRELRTPGQLLRSWYIFAFQLPVLPEWLFRAGDFAILERALRREPVRPGAFTAEDLRQYKNALRRPGALTAAINYYRAAFLHGRRLSREVRRIDVPTLLVWGERDRYLGLHLTEGLETWVPRLRVERLPEASHWVLHDAPERVNQLMIDFLRSSQ